MGYLSIPNLYRPEAQQILAFKQVYALEKIHGTSAHLRWDGNLVHFFSGGERHDKFTSLFDQAKLKETFLEKRLTDVTIFGEAYGGKQQGMSATYGPELKFVAFDVTINDTWLRVPDAEGFCSSFGIDFVGWQLIPTKLDIINFWRDAPSLQATKNGIEGSKLREGIVLRPIYEFTDNRGNRVIAKHKGEAFSERERPVHPVDPEKATQMEKAEALALEWATPMRLEHVINKLISERENKLVHMEDTKELIKRMCVDVENEFDGEEGIIHLLSTAEKKAVGTRTAKLFRTRLEAGIEG